MSTGFTCQNKNMQERITGLFPSFQTLHPKWLIIWTWYLCYLLLEIHCATCDCAWVASDDTYASDVTRYFCMKPLWEKKLEPVIFLEWCFCPCLLVFGCCCFWVGCHVGRIGARAHLWPISLWNPKRRSSQLA